MSTKMKKKAVVGEAPFAIPKWHCEEYNGRKPELFGEINHSARVFKIYRKAVLDNVIHFLESNLVFYKRNISN